MTESSVLFAQLSAPRVTEQTSTKNPDGSTTHKITPDVTITTFPNQIQNRVKTDPTTGAVIQNITVVPPQVTIFDAARFGIQADLNPSVRQGNSVVQNNLNGATAVIDNQQNIRQITFQNGITVAPQQGGIQVTVGGSGVSFNTAVVSVFDPITGAVVTPAAAVAQQKLQNMFSTGIPQASPSHLTISGNPVQIDTKTGATTVLDKVNNVVSVTLSNGTVVAPGPTTQTLAVTRPPTGFFDYFGNRTTTVPLSQGTTVQSALQQSARTGVVTTTAPPSTPSVPSIPLSPPPQTPATPHDAPTVLTPPINPVTGRPVADPKDVTPPPNGLIPPGVDVISPIQPTGPPASAPPPTTIQPVPIPITQTAPTPDQPTVLTSPINPLTGRPAADPKDVTPPSIQTPLPSLPALSDIFDPFDTLMNAFPVTTSLPNVQTSPSGGSFVTDLPSTPSTPPTSGGFFNTIRNAVVDFFSGLFGGSNTSPDTDTQTQTDTPSGVGGGSTGSELDGGGLGAPDSSSSPDAGTSDPFGGLGDFGDGITETQGQGDANSEGGFESTSGQSEINEF